MIIIFRGLVPVKEVDDSFTVAFGLVWAFVSGKFVINGRGYCVCHHFILA